MRFRISLRGCVRPSVCPSVRRSVPCYFRRWKVRIQATSCAVYPALLDATLMPVRRFVRPFVPCYFWITNMAIYEWRWSSRIWCTPRYLFRWILASLKFGLSVRMFKNPCLHMFVYVSVLSLSFFIRQDLSIDKHFGHYGTHLLPTQACFFSAFSKLKAYKFWTNYWRKSLSSVQRRCFLWIENRWKISPFDLFWLKCKAKFWRKLMFIFFSFFRRVCSITAWKCLTEG